MNAHPDEGLLYVMPKLMQAESFERQNLIIQFERFGFTLTFLE
jgi:hypothetical protein